MKISLQLFFFATLFLIAWSCKNDSQEIKTTADMLSLSESETLKAKNTISDEFKNYWYANEAEITSYTLKHPTVKSDKAPLSWYLLPNRF